MADPNANVLKGFCGAVLGTAIGYLLFFVLAQLGLYALAIPGAAVGLTCGWLSGGRSWLLAVICGLLALLLGIMIEWKFAPFVADDSLQFFVTHLHQLSLRTWLMLLIGTGFGVWFGIGREQHPGLRAEPASDRLVDEDRFQPDDTRRQD